MDTVLIRDLVQTQEVEIKTGPFGTQLKASEYVDRGTPVLNVRNLGFSTVNTEKIEMVGNETIKRLSAHTLHTGDIVFGRKGAVERHAFISEFEDGWMQGSDCIRLRVKNERINARYLSYYFLTPQHRSFMLSMCSHGTTMASLNQKIIEMISIPLPERKVQDQVVAVLSALDEKIKNNQEINDNLQQQAAALFSSLYDRSNTEVRFTDLIQILGGGTPKTGENTYWNGNIAFFTPKDVGIPYTLITEKTISKEGLSHCNSRLYPVNTVFVTARGTVGKVGMSGVPMAMNQSCYALVGKETHQLLVYFYTLKAVDRLKHKASGAVFDAITTRDFESEQIMKLSDDDATAFLRVAEPMFQEVLNNNIENLRLSTLRDSLLPKLMSGEIDVSAVQL